MNEELDIYSVQIDRIPARFHWIRNRNEEILRNVQSQKTYLAPEKLLETTAPGLSHNELLALGKMGFHGIRAAVVHSVGLHD